MKAIHFRTAIQLVLPCLLIAALTSCAGRAPEISAPTEPAAVAPVKVQPAANSAAATAAPAEQAEPEGKTVELTPAAPAFEQADVVWIQKRLQELGYYGGAIDGAVGTGTRSAIQDYQRDQDIEADGRPTSELRNFMWRNGG